MPITLETPFSSSVNSLPDLNAGQVRRKDHFVRDTVAYLATVVFALLTANAVERSAPLAATVLRVGALVLSLAWLTKLFSKHSQGSGSQFMVISESERNRPIYKNTNNSDNLRRSRMNPVHTTRDSDPIVYAQVTRAPQSHSQAGQDSPSNRSISQLYRSAAPTPTVSFVHSGRMTPAVNPVHSAAAPEPLFVASRSHQFSAASPAYSPVGFRPQTAASPQTFAASTNHAPSAAAPVTFRPVAERVQNSAAVAFSSSSSSSAPSASSNGKRYNNVVNR